MKYIFQNMHIFKLLGACVMLLAVAGCGPENAWRQKLTLVVETPSGDVSAFSITSVEWFENRIFKDAARRRAEVKGEAVVLDLGKTSKGPRYLFALMGGMRTIAVSTYSQMPTGTYFAAQIPVSDVPKKPQPARDVPRRGYPLLVTFTDINDPKTVKRVNPNDLAATFGRGYALKSITLEITDVPVTEGRVESVLGWFPSYENKQLDGDRYTNLYSKNRFANTLNRLDFSRK